MLPFAVYLRALVAVDIDYHNSHFEGLKRMVTLRGGLGAIRALNPILANMIFGYFLPLSSIHH